MRRILSISIFALLNFSAWAQSSTYTLQQAIDLALANNIQVKQRGLQAEVANVNLKQARSNILPDINASLVHGKNTGRSIDPFSNTYVNQSVNYAGYSLNSGVVLFNGLTLKNNIRQNSSAAGAADMEFKQAKEQLVLNIIMAYLQVLNNEDLLASAMRQKELSGKQLERLRILDSAGVISPAQLADLNGQLMNDELTILDIKSNIQVAKLAFAQLMNIPYDAGIILEKVSTDQDMSIYTKNAQEIFNASLKSFSLIRAVELRKQSAQFALKSARGSRYPSLLLGGNLQTNYSSIAQNATGKISYTEQVENNIFSTLNLGIRVPLFNAYRTKNTIRMAAINVRSASLEEESAKQLLRQQIEQAHLFMTTAYTRYSALLEQVAAYSVSFKAAEARFAAGVGTSVDYLIAKNNLDRANINLIGAQYDFVLRKKLLEYYEGNRSVN